MCVITDNFALYPCSLLSLLFYFSLSLSFFSLSLSLSLSLYLFLYLSLSFRLYIAGLFFNEHFLRSASLFLPLRRVSTLYLESHLHHYDISGGQVRTAHSSVFSRLLYRHTPHTRAHTRACIRARFRFRLLMQMFMWRCTSETVG